ncbi:hypothetical protein Cgig2_017579 [Carnegiea gigantea]|uniref:Rx N-terminal domain-containing protein n=1 Tax=Carnegiea gigantea TaxID=171969 RepID=A0A9Q1KMP0_9CARY|nr:hypothetical protein Cgig2_017579 [Carnegiea gigantea]
MAESIVFDLTVRVLQFLGQSAFERIAPYFGGRDRLNELQETMEMIQARLYDAEKRQEAEEGKLIRSWLQRLKRVMYRLEDLLEEVDIADKQDKQMAPGKLTKTERGASNMINRREETYSFIREEEVIVHNLKFSSLRHIRALDLGSALVKLPSAIGELKHLRYLRAHRLIHCLPKEITKLPYLQTLDLKGLGLPRGTLGLPSNFYKLRSLKHLRILYPNIPICCPVLDMPPRFGELISLQSLDVFVVGKNRLDALSGMNLAAELRIIYSKQRQSDISEAMKANLKGKKLTNLRSDFCSRESITDTDKLLECLQLPWTLKSLTIRGWEGVRFPNWGIDQLPNLVSITIMCCTRCRHLPSFSRLPHIKELSINSCEQLDLWEVKIEDGDISDGGKDNSVMSSTWECLKSLNSLRVIGMSKLQSLPSGIGGITMLHKLSIFSLISFENSALFDRAPNPASRSSDSRLSKLEGTSNISSEPRRIARTSHLQMSTTRDKM